MVSLDGHREFSLANEVHEGLYVVGVLDHRLVVIGTSLSIE